MKNLTFLLLLVAVFSCKDSLQRKAESLADCPKNYIREVVVKANKSNNVGNPNINFYLSRRGRDEHFFYLKYKSRYYFLFYSKKEAGFEKSGLYMDSPYDLLLTSAHKVENELYGKIKGDPKFITKSATKK